MSKETGLRIVVVDDLADAANSLALLLALWGHDAKVCYSGAAALDTARTHQPEVVLLDVGLPRMDGFEVARRLREQPELASTTIIGISGYGDEASRTCARQAGFDHYLLKPIDLDYLNWLLHGAPSPRRVFVRTEGAKQLQEVGS
jgi:CheY-like chemotaxis protein